MIYHWKNGGEGEKRGNKFGTNNDASWMKKDEDEEEDEDEDEDEADDSLLTS